MITSQLIEELLINMGISRMANCEAYKQCHHVKRNRKGANVVCIPATLTGLNKDIFVKKYENKTVFLREIAAINLLTERHYPNADVSIPPNLLYIDKEKKLIVTEAVQGITLSNMLQNTLRLDKIFFNNKYSIQNIFVLIEKLINSLSCIYIRPEEFENGYDHSFKSIGKRIKFKFDQMSLVKDINGLTRPMIKYLKEIERLSEIYEAEQNHLVYVHGDLCPSNIIIVKDHIHLIDFEDSGYGIPGRDLAYLIYLISSLKNNHYYSSYRVRFLIKMLNELYDSMFPIFDRPDFLVKSWEVEWYIDEILLLFKNQKNKNVLSKYIVRRRIKDCIIAIDEILNTNIL